jgi:hypothetical protein
MSKRWSNCLLNLSFLVSTSLFFGTTLLFVCGCNPPPDGTREPRKSTPISGSRTATPQVEGVSNVRFSPSSAEHTPPEDVLQEVQYYIGGGGPGCSRSETWPNASEYRDSVEIMDNIGIQSDGWNPNEIVHVTLLFPDGKVLSADVEATFIHGIGEDCYSAFFSYRPLLTDPLGRYVISFSGKAGTANTAFDVKWPSGSRLVGIEGGLLLFNFAPGERVRFFAYSRDDHGTASFVAWQDFRTDADGQLTIEVPDYERDYIYVAVGNTSGEVHEIMMNEILMPQGSGCDGAPPSRIQKGTKARVTYTDGRKLNVRIGPGTSFAKSGSAPEGSGMSVLDGPTCANGYWWWKVSTDDGQTGWVAEGELGNYFMEPR